MTRFFVMLAIAVVGATPLAAQAPNLDWRTITTTHFYIHFTPPVEGLARRIAADAERAYGELSLQLHPPRGMIDVVLSDDIDVSNGSATPFPTNRIVIYANPPVSESALRYTNDWGQLVITHELTHIFHLDRTRGIWALSQKVLGRAALTFPNVYAPSWLTEGLAVYEESRLAGAGRIEGSEHRMIARAAAIDHHFPAIGALSLAQGRFPFGESAYAYGSLFIDWLARTHGDSAVRRFVEKESADLIPYFVDVPAKQGFGISFTRAWKEFGDSVARSIRYGPPAPMEGWHPLTRDGTFVFAPRWLGDTAVIYSGTPGRESFGAYRVDLAGKRTRIGRRNDRSPNVLLADGSLLYSQLDFVNPYQEREDLWIERHGREHQITFGARLESPDARDDGLIVASQIIPGATRLVLVSPNGKRITPITNGSYDEQWTEPRWSHDGTRIAASRWLRGNISQIVVIDTTGRIERTVSSGHSIEATPSWSSDDAGLFYSSDRTGSAQVYYHSFADNRDFVASNALTGLFEPQSSPRSDHLAAVFFRGDGYHLGDAPCCNTSQWSATPPYVIESEATSTAALVADTSRATKYSPWRTFLPHYWLPDVSQGIDNGYRIGALTSGVDVVGRHTMTATLLVPTNDRGGVTGNVSYQYAGLGVPVVRVDASQDWQSLGGVFARDASRQLLGEVFERTRNADILTTWLHQRARSAYALTGGVGIEHRTHVTTAPVPLSSIDSSDVLGAPTFPSLIAAASFANYQRPPFSISPEDGAQLGVTVRDRMRSGVDALGAASYSTVGTAALYKSLDLPGFAHHVLALRASAGFADSRAAGYYAVGGVSGSTVPIIPGYTIGEGPQTFPVRGFAPSTLIGIRAYTASAEYRLPLLLIGNSPGSLPFFLDRSFLTIFGDYGTAWCPDIRAGREVCNSTSDPILTQHAVIASTGAELNLNAGALTWDTAYRFRLGVAVPTENGGVFHRSRATVYFASGVSF